VDLNPDEEPDFSDYESCEMCGHYPIRFVHTLEHEEWLSPVDVGCICAGHLTEDYATPQLREKELRGRAAARTRWLKRQWRISAKGNLWRRVNCRFLCVFYDPDGQGWRACIDQHFSQRIFPSETAAKLAVFDALQKLNGKV
jgi:hypothetical protein